MRYTSWVLVLLLGCGDTSGGPTVPPTVDTAEPSEPSEPSEPDTDTDDTEPVDPTDTADTGDTGTPTPSPDADGDGFTVADGDCDDADPALTPADADLDGASSCQGDCDDAEPAVRTGLAEICDLLDNDCVSGVDLDGGGVDVCQVAESFVNADQADILFVVDNSCSMADEQMQLGSNGPALVNGLLGVDFHVGVVTTDMTDPSHSGKLQSIGGAAWIDGSWAQADAEAWFDVAMFQGTLGAANEKGLDAAHAALAGQAAGFNAGFLRPDALLHVVVLSDEEDASAVAPGAFYAWFSAMKASPAMSVLHSIVTPVGGCPTGVQDGVRYLDVSALTGGTMESICAADYAPVLASIAAHVGASAHPGDQTFPLAHLPDLATLVVTATEADGTVTVLGPADVVHDPVDNTLEILGVWPIGTAFLVEYRIDV